jgi:glycosyltransferase involved in cell wall biosynthesis
MVSIIIPTYWKRVQLAFQHANIISKYNCFKNNDFEIIIIDSSEKDFINIENINNINYYNLDLKTQNSLCLKRNFGASKSNGKILIFLDDDVLPDINYFNFVMMNLGPNQVICGNIFFPIERVNELPLVRYK